MQSLNDANYECVFQCNINTFVYNSLFNEALFTLTNVCVMQTHTHTENTEPFVEANHTSIRNDVGEMVLFFPAIPRTPGS